ncbi:MAG TPA: hypothetical protein VMZ91_00765, partial [Candidatus Paceibacterota bacterium]|nr:hypothetical protein [Candidatus Paceibacterota bacterium]
NLNDKEREKKSINMVVVARMLCFEISKMNSEDTKIQFDGLYNVNDISDKKDWIISVKNNTTRETTKGDDSLKWTEFNLSQDENGNFDVKLLDENGNLVEEID